MTAMLRERKMQVHWLPECQYARGKWFMETKYHQRCPQVMHSF